jgi:N-acylneuraminate cytidylyltransferase/CMP-N,N'-diacetyllegionaminic acid synthase
LEIVGIIPARGGSKGLPKKNIKNLDGKPLIYYTIKEARKSKYLTNFFVSTENEEISKTVKKYGVEVIPRPKNLAKDKTTSMAVIRHAINYLNKNKMITPDAVVILQPTSPFRKVIDIDTCVKIFLENKFTSVVSVCISKHPPSWNFKIVNKKLQKIIKSPQITRRQDKSPVYNLNGAVYVASSKNLLEDNFEFGKGHLPYLMSRYQSIDIDTYLDFKIAEMLIKNKSLCK